MAGSNLGGNFSRGIRGVPASLPLHWMLGNGYLIGPGAQLGGANLSGLNLDGVDLTGASLGGALSGGITGSPIALPAGWSLIGGYLFGQFANLANAHLAGFNLSNLDLFASNLTGADLSGATLSNIGFSNAHLDNVNLTGAQLSGDNFYNGYLPGADLSNATIAGTSFTNVDFTNAKFTGATISGSNFENDNLASTNLSGVHWQNTICPDYSNSDIHVDGCLSLLRAPFSITVNGAASATITVGTQATLAETGLPGSATGTVRFYTSGNTLLCSATVLAGSCNTSASMQPGIYSGIHAVYSGDGTYGTSSSANVGVLIVQAVTVTSGPRCSKLTGKATGTLTFKLCAPLSFVNRVGAVPGTVLAGGGTLTWKKSGQTSILALTATSPGQGGCKKNSTEHDLTGIISGGTSTYAPVGDSVSLRICESRLGAVSLVPGTTASL